MAIEYTLAQIRDLMQIYASHAPVRWPQDIALYSPELQDKIDDLLTAEIVHQIRALAYLRARRQGNTHAQAVRAQNARARQVRRLLGFSYPDAPITF